jgi:hypothetical protein
MLNEMQASLLPYLGLVGENPWLQALSVVCASWLLAWIFDRFISSTLKKLAQRTRFEIDDALINYLHNPVYTSVILLGFALAVNLLKIGEPYDFFIFSSLQTVAYLVWTVFLLRVVRTLLRKIAANDERLTVLHPQTLPLFENLAIILIIVLSVYIVFSAWGVDMTAWLARTRWRTCFQASSSWPTRPTRSVTSSCSIPVNAAKSPISASAARA